MKPVKVGMLGFGTVGCGTFMVLRRNQEEIRRRAGRNVQVAKIAIRNQKKVISSFGKVLDSVEITNDFNSVVDDPLISIVAEMIGGTDIARDLVLRAIENSKHVVTANKALLAVHGTEIFKAAHKKGVIVAFEAAVAGGIPIIKALREGLTANRIQYIAGIINGTTNYILSEMSKRNLNFGTALAAAKKLGYAETDPTFDIDGIDAAHKMTIMSAIAFGIPVQFNSAYIEGISKLDIIDMHYAEELGYRIKLLGITRRAKYGIELRVHPTLILEKRLLAIVDGVMNAIVVHADVVGTTLYYGKGAGAEATASSVIADIIDITRLHAANPRYHVPYLAFQPDCLSDIPILPIDEVMSAYYLRIPVSDEIGVLADITRILADSTISIDILLQKKSDQIKNINIETDIIIITHVTLEKHLNAAIIRIENLKTVTTKVTKIRIEALD
ncbi:MAG: homoserine dehydrogenase [Burkholderia sp.]|nr:homoserine dehydrogenase [Burkholderia sp.]